MKPKDFFLNPSSASQRHYEALRLFYVDGRPAAQAASQLGLSPSYFKKLRFEFSKKLAQGHDPFFPEKKRGPQRRMTSDVTIAKIIALRKQNHSIQDIRVVLSADGTSLSLDTVDKILKEEGFAPLPKRTSRERIEVKVPRKLEAPQAVALEITNERFSTEQGAGALLFLPLLEKLGIVQAIRASGFPRTSCLSDVQSVLSFLALKLIGAERHSHDSTWNMDRALGLFAGLNVLPKSGTLSTYSYRVMRQATRNLLVELSRVFKDDEREEGEFNLDFKAIPHWGDESVLEKNWSGSRSRRIKSLLSLIVQDPSSGYISYTDAEIKHHNQNEAVLEFVDFWKEGRGVAPKMLIFDSKLTTYRNLDLLNRGKPRINFLTLRRRGKKLIDQVSKIPEDQWRKISVERAHESLQTVRVHDGLCKLRDYQGDVRQVILTDHGREKPAFLITNDFGLDVRLIVKKYARRWLVEQEINEQIVFFSLNHPSSSVVVKVDFDLCVSLLAHNLYRLTAQSLPGFESCMAPTLYRKFFENGANVEIQGSKVRVQLKKKTHLPILFEVPWLKEVTHLSWMGIDIEFLHGTSS
jgi:transposase